METGIVPSGEHFPSSYGWRISKQPVLHLRGRAAVVHINHAPLPAQHVAVCAAVAGRAAVVYVRNRKACMTRSWTWNITGCPKTLLKSTCMQ